MNILRSEVSEVVKCSKNVSSSTYVKKGLQSIVEFSFTTFHSNIYSVLYFCCVKLKRLIVKAIVMMHRGDIA